MGVTYDVYYYKYQIKWYLDESNQKVNVQR